MRKARPWCWSPMTPRWPPARSARSASATGGSSLIRRRRECLLMVLLGWPLLAGATVFSGEVRMDDAQGIYTPPSMSSPVVLRYYVPDGTRVGKGDVLLRIDAGPAEA